jgi:DNA-binding MarR family transcriptional regulator
MKPLVVGEGFRGPRGPISFLLRQAHTALRGAIDRELAPLGITGPQFSALNVIARLPAISGTELARVSMLRQQTTNEILLALADRGLVDRSPRDGDRRILAITLTREGRRVIADARRIVRRLECRMVAALAPADTQRLRDWLVHCAKALASDTASEAAANSRLRRTRSAASRSSRADAS